MLTSDELRLLQQIAEDLTYLRSVEEQKQRRAESTEYVRTYRPPQEYTRTPAQQE